MKVLHTSLFISIALCLSIISCTDDVERTFVSYTESEYELLSDALNLPLGLYDYGQDRSRFLNTFSSSSSDIFSKGNISRNHKATLGRVLFYDTKLSVNNTVSSGSCHQQQLAFADDVAFSVGFEGELSLRNSLPLGNTIGFESAYGGGSFSSSRAFFGWDEANRNIASQSEAAITSSLEMGMHDMDALVDKLRDDEVYKLLFKKAFDHSSVNKTNILSSLDIFINSIVSNSSRFDIEALKVSGSSQGRFDKPFAAFTASENRGKSLYNTACASCHSIDHSVTAQAIANNGLDINYTDKGKYQVSGQEWDKGVFKVPFLRNIELTAPYMHDGRFNTLEEVIDHYTSGIKPHINLDHKLKNGFDFTNKDKTDLIAYLKTLTDDSLTADDKWSDPFK